jgi:hypothetical protein
MRPFHSRKQSNRRWRLMIAIAAVGLGLSLEAQSPPPVRGTIALEGTMKKFYRAANVLVVTTIDGVEHVYRFAKDLVVHGGEDSGIDALEGLREGSTVVVHYTVEGQQPTAHEVDRFGAGGLDTTEGVVTGIDRRRLQITVRYDNGTKETFALTERAATEAAVKDAVAGDIRVVIYYSNEEGKKVAHFFRQTAKS